MTGTGTSLEGRKTSLFLNFFIFLKFRANRVDHLEDHLEVGFQPLPITTKILQNPPKGQQKRLKLARSVAGGATRRKRRKSSRGYF